MSNLIESFSEFKELKNIDKRTLQKIIEDVFRGILKKKFQTDDHIDVIVNTDKGDFQILLNKEVVDDGEVENPNMEISLSDARKINSDFEIGEEVSEEFKFSDFGRRNILSIRQNLLSKVLEVEKDHIYNFYKEKVGEIITGEVHQFLKREVVVLDDDGNELILPKSNQIPGDFYRKGDNIRAIISEVSMRNGTPVVILSRTDNTFLEKLFENEIPEIFDGLITIKKSVREPGFKSKILVESYDDRVDPVGCCVGSGGSRINSIVRELRGENIDVISYSSNPFIIITRSLSPAKISNLEIDDVEKIAKVYLKSDQVSPAIGKNGNNIKLTSKLSGYEVEIYSDDVDNDDVLLDDFSDEIDLWIIENLKSIGCDTAKSVLESDINDLVKRSDLEEETIREIIEILSAEFE